MNVKEQKKRLEDIFRKKNNNSFAVAITGCWGVGKTHFWNNFIKEKAKAEQERQYLPFSIREKYKNLFNKKYSYVSLFGIENLADLRATISMNMSSNSFNENVDKNLEVPKPFKKLVSGLKDLKFNNSEYGISGSARLLESLLYHQVRDAIICFDDFERMSNKLDIRDVMGLANQLKLERNCQIILILDESKTDQENEKKYAEYKEKLIDETIKITSVEPLIRENVQDIDERLIDLMVKFANELGIHNFRFFQKVITLYKQFREQLPNEVAYSTKEIILIRILQGYFIEDFGQDLKLKWSDFSLENAAELLFEENPLQNMSDVARNILKKLNRIDGEFFNNDLWLTEFKKWFYQTGELDLNSLEKLANSELISAHNNKIKDDLAILMDSINNLECCQNYCDELFDRSRLAIGVISLEKLNFYCYLLKKIGRNDLAKNLKREVLTYLNENISKIILDIEDEIKNGGLKKGNLFHWYIVRYRTNNPLVGLPSLFALLKANILYGGKTSQLKIVIQNSNEYDLEKFIFEDSSKDVDLAQFTKKELIEEILKFAKKNQLHSIIQQKIKNLLLVKKQTLTSIEAMKIYDFVIENLIKEGLL